MSFIVRFFITVFFLSSSLLLAQPCGTDQHHQHQMEHNAAYRASYYEMQRRVQEQARLLERSNERRTVVTIPVVVHVIHLGEPLGLGSNISSSQILRALDGLNERFRNQSGAGADMEIEFCLANTDPDGNPTSGINRVDGSGVPNFAGLGISVNGSLGADPDEVRSLSYWDNLSYYNIWIVHAVYGDVAGYANYPNTFFIYDGTVLEAAFMTYESYFLAHEVGHGFDLKHTFEGTNPSFSCPPDVDCTWQGDAICDTRPHKATDCSTTVCTGSGTLDNSIYNHMSYCPVTNRFTAGQKDWVSAMLQTHPRIHLWNSTACQGTSNCAAVNCDDGSTCTTDVCVNGVCEHEHQSKKNFFSGTPLPRSQVIQFSIGGKLYTGLGKRAQLADPQTLYADFWEYNPATDTWTRKADFPATLRQNMQCFTIGNKGYAGLGYIPGPPTNICYNDLWEYNPATDTWTQKTDFPGQIRMNPIAISIEEKGYAGMGYNENVSTNGGYLQDFWEYDAETDVWTQKADIPAPRSEAQGFSIGGKGYIGWGRKVGGFVSDLWQYNPATNTWTQKKDFPGGDIETTYVLGSTGYAVTENDFWNYNPHDNRWTRIPEPFNVDTNLLLYAQATVVENTVYFYSGLHLNADMWKFCLPCDMPAAPDSILGNTYACAGAQQVYSVNYIAENTYTWELPASWSFQTSPEASSITVTTGDTAGVIRVYATNACHTGEETKLEVTCNVGIGEKNPATEVRISPNPNTGNFMLFFDNNLPHEILITDMLGKVVLAPTLVRGTAELSLDKPVAGIYFLRVDGAVRKFVVRGS